MTGMIAGLGFREAATTTSLLDAIQRVGGHGLRKIALPQTKAYHPSVLALARAGYEVIAISAETISATPTLTESAPARAAFGTGSVAEACALAALGPGARLAGPRVISRDGMATAALALAGDLE